MISESRNLFLMMFSVSVWRPELSIVSRAASLFSCSVFSGHVETEQRQELHQWPWLDRYLHESTVYLKDWPIKTSIMILSLRQIYFTLLLYINEDTIHVEFKDISRSAAVWDQLAGTDWLLCYWMTKDTLNLNLVKQTCKVSGKHLWLMDYVTAPQISIRPRYFEFIVKIRSILIFT